MIYKQGLILFIYYPLLSTNTLSNISRKNQLIREITEAKTQKWTIPPKDLSLEMDVSS